VRSCEELAEGHDKNRHGRGTAAGRPVPQCAYMSAPECCPVRLLGRLLTAGCAASMCWQQVLACVAERE
jgi:hypothetical protein